MIFFCRIAPCSDSTWPRSFWTRTKERVLSHMRPVARPNSSSAVSDSSNRLARVAWLPDEKREAYQADVHRTVAFHDCTTYGNHGFRVSKSKCILHILLKHNYCNANFLNMYRAMSPDLYITSIHYSHVAKQRKKSLPQKSTVTEENWTQQFHCFPAMDILWSVWTAERLKLHYKKSMSSTQIKLYGTFKPSQTSKTHAIGKDTLDQRGNSRCLFWLCCKESCHPSWVRQRRCLEAVIAARGSVKRHWIAWHRRAFCISYYKIGVQMSLRVWEVWELEYISESTWFLRNLIIWSHKECVQSIYSSKGTFEKWRPLFNEFFVMLHLVKKAACTHLITDKEK